MSIKEVVELCEKVRSSIQELTPDQLEECECENCEATRELWIPLYRTIVRSAFINELPNGAKWTTTDHDILVRMVNAYAALRRTMLAIEGVMNCPDVVLDRIKARSDERAKIVRDAMDAGMDVVLETAGEDMAHALKSPALMVTCRMFADPYLRVRSVLGDIGNDLEADEIGISILEERAGDER